MCFFFHIHIFICNINLEIIFFLLWIRVCIIICIPKKSKTKFCGGKNSNKCFCSDWNKITQIAIKNDDWPDFVVEILSCNWLFNVSLVHVYRTTFVCVWIKSGGKGGLAMYLQSILMQRFASLLFNTDPITKNTYIHRPVIEDVSQVLWQAKASYQILFISKGILELLYITYFISS